MTGGRYNVVLRLLYGSIIDSRLSNSDLKFLALELRRGRLADELSFMIERALEHFEDSRHSDMLDSRVEEAERLLKSRRVSKADLASIIRSLGVSSISQRGTIRQMLDEFFYEASDIKSNQLFDIISRSKSDDAFLEGISKKLR